MKKAILEGKWEQVKGKLRQKWGELTDDDLAQIEGQRELLVGRLKEKYGKTQEEAEELVEDFEREFGED